MSYFNMKYPEMEIVDNMQMCGSENVCDATSYKVNHTININSQFLHSDSWKIEDLLYINNQTLAWPWLIHELKYGVNPIGLW